MCDGASVRYIEVLYIIIIYCGSVCDYVGNLSILHLFSVSFNDSAAVAADTFLLLFIFRHLFRRIKIPYTFTLLRYPDNRVLGPFF